MNESIKDKFLKEHELSMEDLDEISGGVDAFPCRFWYKCTIGNFFYTCCERKENGECPNGYT